MTAPLFRIGLSPTQITRLEEDDKYPLRVHVGFRVFWVEAEVDEWMQHRADERARPPSRVAELLLRDVAHLNSPDAGSVQTRP
jgi:predicted DNA-binding transcriptional regulator AlpA